MWFLTVWTWTIPQSCMCSNTWSPASSTVWGGYRSFGWGAWLADVDGHGSLGWTFEGDSPALLPIPPLLPVLRPQWMGELLQLPGQMTLSSLKLFLSGLLPQWWHSSTPFVTVFFDVALAEAMLSWTVVLLPCLFYFFWYVLAILSSYLPKTPLPYFPKWIQPLKPSQLLVEWCLNPWLSRGPVLCLPTLSSFPRAFSLFSPGCLEPFALPSRVFFIHPQFRTRGSLLTIDYIHL